jgi:hypothetical protein
MSALKKKVIGEDSSHFLSKRKREWAILKTKKEWTSQQ